MRTSNTTLLAAFVTLAVGATGCATRTGSGAAIGGASGAVVGAGVGAAAGGKKGALIGAAVGATTGASGGALVGRYMDRQEKELRDKVQTARIERQGDQLLVNFNSAILFDFNKATLKADAKKDLADFANVLREYNETNLVIEGHTDSTGPRDVNEELSLARANEVIQFLTDRGVRINRMTARGYADDRPIASNATTEGRQQNRRVQIQIAANEELRAKDSAASRSADPDGERRAQRNGVGTR